MKLALLAEAAAELEHAAIWYDDRNGGLGNEFMDVASEALIVIAQAPDTWPL